ncbi:MAG: hydrolase TatD, partial [Clostridiales bacterium]|nr:hydrolase TatD [Clostridiales bacterium]
YVIEKLAVWKGVSPEEMTHITWENGRRLFRLVR